MSSFNLVAYISPVKTDSNSAIKFRFMRLLKCQHDSWLYKKYCTLYKYNILKYKNWDAWRKYFPWYLKHFIWNGHGKFSVWNCSSFDVLWCCIRLPSFELRNFYLIKFLSTKLWGIFCICPIRNVSFDAWEILSAKTVEQGSTHQNRLVLEPDGSFRCAF